ncbi:WD domain, G-beta repeat protein (macronuclear) [Tetrahymena thermophila SB210]|uniref:WD domain, G-beta repeat protein n=1 Tax=Tetrahymena thermophila (strain SB210) TaxID=312017 RepID=Q237R1_TETTS|nr:WD domain, G-beta repeat protein [Tetrahymena thermophila SB210]EAR92680.2 WD domain, G-beta repeat protein [Tetrahymena thermophila SB210]|eukprot:XP_001012925.2 WD domain, G-beta repeat protein [Tetrahymena thermophila SB210]
MISPIYQESASNFRVTKKETNAKSMFNFAEKQPKSYKMTENERRGEEMYRQTIVKQKQLEQKGDLNNYEYCNPENKEDELPQPYKFINGIINEMIFHNINLKIFEIEKTYKSDPNYEGNLSEFPPQGSFELNGITAISNSSRSRYNQIFVGDKSGSLFLLDLNKKTQVCKKEITPSKRIINISSQTIPYGETQLTTISIISRADPIVYIYRILQGDNKLYHNYSIKIPIALSQAATNNVTDQAKFANPLPFKAEIGINGDFVSVCTYNGDVHIFQIPDPPQIPKYDPSQDDPSNQVYGSQISGAIQSPRRQSMASHQRILTGQILEMKPVDIDKPFYSINFQGQKVSLNYKELMAKINDDTFKALNPQIVAQQLLEQQLKEQAAAKEKKDVKKDAKKGAKDQGPTEQELLEKQQQEQKQQKKEILFNDIVPIPEYKVSPNGQDISEDIPLPKFKPLVKFLKTQVTLPDSKKYFGRPRYFELVTDLLITWKGVKSFELHHLRPAKIEYLISVLYDALQKEDKSLSSGSETKSIAITVNSKNTKTGAVPAQQTPPPPPPPPTQAQLRQLLPPIKPKLKKTFSLIYPVTCLNINESESFAAFGLKEGSIIVWDLQFNLQKWALDRHTDEVTCIEFLENWRLVSGSKDGTVHLHDLEKGKMMMKRTNVFMEKKKNSVESIAVSNSGLAFVLDSLKNLRLYDLWHGQKIAKMQASSHLDTRTKSWTLFPQCVLNAQRDQLCILTDIHPPFDKEEEKQIQECGEIERIALKKQIIDQKVKNYDKNTNISIFRVYDILINIFPGLANVSRKGIDRDKLINLFGHLSIEDLNNPSFEIPTIGPPAMGQNTLSQDITKNSSKRMSKAQFPSILKNKSRDGSLNASQTLQVNNSQTMKQQKSQLQQQQQQQQYQQQQILSQYVQQQKQKSTASFDEEPDLNSSFKTQLTHATHIKAIPHPQHGQKTRLTKEVLHPERFLLERIRLPGQELKDYERDTIEACRKRFDEMEQRENKVMNDLARLAQELEKNEEKRVKRIKEMQMRQTSQPKQNTFKRGSQPVENKTSYQ